MKIDLYLMGGKGEAVLTHLCNSNQVTMISSVISARDPGIIGDGYEAIKLCAIKHGLAFRDKLEPLQPVSTAIAIGWRWLITHSYDKLIVLHDSLLPRYRGFNPLVSYLINQESEIGVTAIVANDQYDRGPMIGQRKIGILHPLRIADAIATITPLYTNLAGSIVEALQAGSPLTETPQDETLATYSLWRDEDDYRIDWTLSAAEIHRFIYAVGNPYAGAKTAIEGRIVRIIDAEPVNDVRIENRTPGKIIFLNNGCPVVVCGFGLLRILAGYYEDNRSELIPFAKFRSRFS